MIDRELLELAAKAAGVETEHRWVSIGPYSDGSKEEGFATIIGLRHVLWNPLTNDGDAFRLMVELGLELDFKLLIETVEIRGRRPSCAEPYGNDICAANRRAIVRAAASLAEPQP